MKRKVVLITGGSSGIGKAIGIHLQNKEYKVYGTTRNLCKQADFNHFSLLEMDVKNVESIKQAVAEIIKLEGVIDVLINNAGIGITGPLEETPNEEIESAFKTNFFGPLNVIKVVLPYMRLQKNGLIINMTSVAGYMGLPYRGIYTATKSALINLTETLRLETKQFGIKVTSLAPGDFATDIAAGRYHSPFIEESPYTHTYKRILDSINDDVDKGKPPVLVAQRIEGIINTRNPKVHYKVGAFIQKFSLILKRMLPDTFYERLLLKWHKL